MDDVKLILVDPQADIADAWRERFKSFANVDVVHGYFEQLPQFDCMVSAANSFGLMDGGVDLAITRFFGVQLMARVQARIIAEYRGEQPVGTSMIVETGHEKHPFIAHTPTMRVPLQITYTDNVYLAMWAMLLAVWKHNAAGKRPITTIACPGLGTATGRVAPDEAARQMALAYDHFLNPPQSIDWNFATKRQGKVIYGGNIGLHI